MKAFIFFLALGMCICVNLSAQTNYYTETKTFYEDGYTYQCDIDKVTDVSLYNIECRFYNKVEQIDLRTGKKYNGLLHMLPHLERESRTKPQCFSIVNKAFPAEIKAKVNRIELQILLYIDPKTGEIADVVFCFPSEDYFAPYALTPVSVYREIEVELKKNVRFTPTAEGKNLNYIFKFWMQDPNVTIKNVPATPPGGLEIVPDDDDYRRDDPPFIDPWARDGAKEE